MKLSPSLISKISSIIHAIIFLLSYLSFLFSCQMYLHLQDSVLAFLCFHVACFTKMIPFRPMASSSFISWGLPHCCPQKNTLLRLPNVCLPSYCISYNCNINPIYPRQNSFSSQKPVLLFFFETSHPHHPADTHYNEPGEHCLHTLNSSFICKMSIIFALQNCCEDT